MPLCTACEFERPKVGKDGRCPLCVSMRIYPKNSAASASSTGLSENSATSSSVPVSAQLDRKEQKAQKRLAELQKIREKLVNVSASSASQSTIQVAPCSLSALQTSQKIEVESSVFTMEYWKGRAKKELDEKPFNELVRSVALGYWANYDQGKVGVREEREVHHVARMFPAIEAELATRRHLPSIKIYRNMLVEEANAIVEWNEKKKTMSEVVARELNKAHPSSSSSSASPAAMAADPEASEKELLDLLGDLIIPVKNHLADLEQALTYHQAKETMEFIMKPGAHELMFTPKYMAILRNGTGAAPFIAASSKDIFPPGKQGEGGGAGYLGIKSEKGDKVSLSLKGGGPSAKLLFQWFVESAKKFKPDVASGDGNEVATSKSSSQVAASGSLPDCSSLADASGSSPQTGTQAASSMKG